MNGLVILAVGALLLTGCSAAQSSPQATPAKSCDGYVALTYDDGPTEVTEAVSDALLAHDMTATFFMMGESVVKFPKVAKKIARKYPIGNHTYGHPHLSELQPATLERELSDTNKVIEQATGRTPTLFRPPYGDTNKKIKATAQKLGMTEVIWTLDTFDWKGKNAKQIATAFKNVEAGDIVLMHDDKPSDVEAVKLIAKVLEEKQLCTGSIAPSETSVKAWDGVSFKAEVRKP